MRRRRGSDYVASVDAIRLRACAKINLFLRVLGRRPDGYHEIETVFHSVDLCDELCFTRSDGGFRLETRLDDRVGGVLPAPTDDLVVHAAAALLEARPGSPGAIVSVTKRIPIAAGLGGGSANAAATLVALNDLWQLGLDEAELHTIAASLGSDVAYCLRGGPALGTSRGELLVALKAPQDLWFVLGITDARLSTAEVYARWQPADRPRAGIAELTAALERGDVAAVASLMHNDLEVAAMSLLPELHARKHALLEAGAHAACVSGSGPTLLGVASDERHARRVATRVENHFERVEVARSRRCSLERVAS